MSIDRGMDKEDVVHIYNGILLSHKKNEIMPFAATWMELESLILSEENQADTYYVIYVGDIILPVFTLSVSWKGSPDIC